MAEYSNGEFRLTHGKNGDFFEFCREMTKKEPLILDDERIVAGFLPLTPVLPDCSFGAYLRAKRKNEISRNK